MVSKLVWLIGEVESGNNPDAPARDYDGNISSNDQYQQSAAYVKEFGQGPAGIENQARQLLKRKSNYTVGAFYSAYNHGSVLDWPTYSRRFPLQARNFLAKAKTMGYNQATPLASLLNEEMT